MKMSLLESVLKVSGQTERQRAECDDRHYDVSAFHSAQATSIERIPDGNVSVNCQQHRQPHTQQT